MQTKTIKSILRRKHDDWLKSIKSEKVRELARANTIITGGSIANMLLDEDVTDFDLYFRDGETAMAVAKYYVDELKAKVPDLGDIFVKQHGGGRVAIQIPSAGVASINTNEGRYQFFEATDPESGQASEYLDAVLQPPKPSEEERYSPLFMTSNALTLSGKIQIVIRFFGDIGEIHKNFDFQHCMGSWDSKTGELHIPKETYECLLTRRLLYKGSLYPICSMIRTRKFIERGFKCNAGQYLKMAMQIAELDLDNIEVLQDQLTGVDVAYFLEIIRKLRAFMQEKGDGHVDRTYLLELIDRIF